MMAIEGAKQKLNRRKLNLKNQGKGVSRGVKMARQIFKKGNAASMSEFTDLEILEQIINPSAARSVMEIIGSFENFPRLGKVQEYIHYPGIGAATALTLECIGQVLLRYMGHRGDIEGDQAQDDQEFDAEISELELELTA